ncbi:MAG: hypothetical protein RSD49_18255 [Hafnia sp.]
MAKNKPRWQPVSLIHIGSQKFRGTLTNELAMKIWDAWKQLPGDEKNLRPYLCGDEIRFKAPNKDYHLKMIRLE